MSATLRQPVGDQQRSEPKVRIEKQGRIPIVRIEGSLCADRVIAVRNTVKQGLPRQAADVVLDFSGVDVIDGDGLEWLIEWCEQCSRRGGSLVLCCVAEVPRALLQITAAGAMIECVDDVQKALSRLM